MRLKSASLAILGIAALGASMLASPAVAEGTKAKAKHTQAQAKVSQSAKGQRQVQRHATNRSSQRMRNASAALPGGRGYRGPAGPGELAGNVVGGAVATAGAIATAPFRAFQ